MKLRPIVILPILAATMLPLFAGCSQQGGISQAPDLFAPARPGRLDAHARHMADLPPSAGPFGTACVRTRLVETRRQVLDDQVRAFTAERDNRMTFNLFDDAQFEGVIEATARPSADSVGYSGRILGDGAGGTFTILLYKGRMLANVRVPSKGTFEIRPVGDAAHLIGEIDESRFPECGVGRQVLPAPQAAPGRRMQPMADEAAAADDDGSRFDVLVVYTPAAATTVGGAHQIEALIDLAAFETNIAYQNSGIASVVQIVHREQTPYTESGSFRDDLLRLAGHGDGFMDDVHALRDGRRADFVALIVATGDACGMAYVMNAVSSSFEDRAFSVVRYDCATGYYSFAHELGHNMGCCHALNDGPCSGAFPDAYGWRFDANGQTCRTIMAYAPGTRIQHFANPNVTFNDKPTGSDTANNAAVIGRTAPTAANFRRSGG